MPQAMKDILSAPIPLSVVAFLILQTMGFVWWGTNVVNGMAARIAAVEVSINQQQKVDENNSSHEGRIIVLEQLADRVRDDLAEIKALIRGGAGSRDDINSTPRRPLQ